MRSFASVEPVRGAVSLSANVQLVNRTVCMRAAGNLVLQLMDSEVVGFE